MKKWPNNSGAQVRACLAFGDACCSDIAIKQAIASIDGIEAVVSAMRMFPNECRIQKYDCGALVNLLGIEENAKYFVLKFKEL